jgi:hypothetical protein
MTTRQTAETIQFRIMFLKGIQGQETTWPRWRVDIEIRRGGHSSGRCAEERKLTLLSPRFFSVFICIIETKTLVRPIPKLGQMTSDQHPLLVLPLQWRFKPRNVTSTGNFFARSEQRRFDDCRISRCQARKIRGRLSRSKDEMSEREDSTATCSIPEG